jgi:Uma2 family endonuclease
MVEAELPGEVTDAEMSPPEGDRHFRPKVRALDALQNFFRRQKRRIYVAAELPVYYPAARRFAPDLLAVLDVEDKERDKWLVSAERRGLDWVLEVHVGGDRKKDAETNVKRYAEHGIPEYFIYDRARGRLLGYRLPSPEARIYTPIVPQGGLYASTVFGLDLQVASDRLRFFAGTALLLESEELIARLDGMVEVAQARTEAEAKRAEEEASRAEQEASRADAAERELAELREELARLKRET